MAGPIIYEVLQPRYADDELYERGNPVTSTSSHSIPGVLCPSCGPWASSVRLRVPVPEQLESFNTPQFLPLDAWRDAQRGWAELLGVAPEVVEPGAEFGPPQGRCTAAITEDIVFPTPGEVWVRERVRTELEAGKLVGLEFAEVQLTGVAGVPLWELVARGRAWTESANEDQDHLCGLCGRRTLPGPANPRLDLNRWDGSDVMTIDMNPNRLFVTDRVARVFELGRFTNVVLARR